MNAVQVAAPEELFIGGAWQPATGGATFPVDDPATGEAIARVADGDVSDGLRAVDAAHSAGAAWAATAPRHRSEVLRRAYELMIARTDEIAELICTENGKALPDARSEVAYAAEFFRWYAEEAVRVPGRLRTAPSGANQILVRHEPVGVAVLVTPWNFPAAMATRKIAPALAAGCTVVLKPAPQTPLTALALADLLTDAGVPAGVVNVVTTTAAEQVITAMLHDDRVRMLSFTGSTEVGRALLRTAADRVLRCAMELGGNAPFIVLPDASVDDAVKGALVAKMRNGGQACTAANRFYVHRSLHDRFAAALAERMGAIRVGDGKDPATACGPLVDRASVDKVTRLVDDCLARGARTLVGGSAPDGPGYFYPPTVLADVPPDASILHAEVFGPVAPVVPFDTEDDVVAAANDTPYGLVAYVYSGDLARGLRVSERLEAGMVALNRGLVSDPAAPFGGVKQSGLGREGSEEGMLEYMETKYIATSW